jgi:phytoene dehydrogenase-like protein
MDRPPSAAGVDAVVIGAGHNGLVCAAYLARAGRSVVVLESRDQVGGCASSVAALGTRVNTCNCDHTMILATGIVEELELAAYGLRYLDVDPLGIAIGWGDEPPFVQWRSVERTLDGLARISPDVARSYRRYLDAALPVARLLLAVQGSAGTTRSIIAAAARLPVRDSSAVMRWARSSLAGVLGSFGLPPWLISAAATIGPAVWGAAPDAPGTGLAAAGFAMRHLVGVGRPVGGSGALPEALAGFVTAHGGVIRTSARVDGLLVDGGRAHGVRLADGTRIGAATVICAVDPRTMYLHWLGGVPSAATSRRRWAGQPAPDGYESKVDAVVSSLPVLRALDRVPADVLPPPARNVPTIVISPTPQQQVLAAAAARRGVVSDPPMFLVNTPSALDPTMCPTGDAHVLSLEVLWTPYALSGGWEGSPAPRQWLELLAGACEPGLLDSVRDWRAMTPPDYEREFAMPRGYAPSYSAGILAALLGRRPELSRYRTSVGCLFLTGAATFPGAGVWGASGRNAAATVLAA